VSSLCSFRIPDACEYMTCRRVLISFADENPSVLDSHTRLQNKEQKVEAKDLWNTAGHLYATIVNNWRLCRLRRPIRLARQSAASTTYSACKSSLPEKKPVLMMCGYIFLGQCWQPRTRSERIGLAAASRTLLVQSHRPVANLVSRLHILMSLCVDRSTAGKHDKKERQQA
jgi:hypothetical protein